MARVSATCSCCMQAWDQSTRGVFNNISIAVLITHYSAFVKYTYWLAKTWSAYMCCRREVISATVTFSAAIECLMAALSTSTPDYFRLSHFWQSSECLHWNMTSSLTISDSVGHWIVEFEIAKIHWLRLPTLNLWNMAYCWVPHCHVHIRCNMNVAFVDTMNTLPVAGQWPL